MTLNEMLDKIEAQEIGVSVYKGYVSYNLDWSITLEKHGDGVALKAEASAPSFESALRKAFTKFFRAAEVGVDFATALPPPEPTTTRIEDEIPF